MKRALNIGLAIACLVLGTYPRQLFAAIVEADNVEMIAYGLSQAENTANMVVAYSPTMTVCSGGAFYIAPEDKQIYATFLTAQMSGIHVNFKYDNSATAVTVPAWSATLSCKIVSVFVDKTGY